MEIVNSFFLVNLDQIITGVKCVTTSPGVISGFWPWFILSPFRWQRSIIQTLTKTTLKLRRSLRSWLKPTRFEASLHQSLFWYLSPAEIMRFRRADDLSSGAQRRGEEETVRHVWLRRVRCGTGRRRTSAVLGRRSQCRPRGAFPQDLWRVFRSARLRGFQCHLRSATRGQIWSPL